MPNGISVAFVVNIILPDDSPGTVADATQELTYAAENTGMVIAAVAPYQRESLEAAGGLDGISNENPIV